MRRARADRRRAGVLLTVLMVLAGGMALRALEPATTAMPEPAPNAAAPLPQADELGRRFDEAVVMLHARRYEQAASALHRVLVLSPNLPEAHVNMGFALLGLKRAKEARNFFDRATSLRPGLANAYYGLALASEADGDLPFAVGAMRSYLHLARDERPEHLRRARAALWEWETAAPRR